MGKEKGWFESGDVLMFSGIALVAFAAFVIWELTDKHPIVDLKVFRHTGFSIATGVISLTFGLFFSTMVLVPLWLQTNMGYTATWAGNLTAFNGILGVVISPIVARLMGKYDARILAFVGLVGMAVVMGWRAMFTPQISFGAMIPVQLAQGAFMPLFFIPLMAIALGDIKQSEMAGASGLLTFARILAGAVAASVVTTSWENEATHMRAAIVSGMDNGAAAMDAMTASGMAHAQAATALEGMIHSQAVMLATNQMFAIMAPAVLCASVLLFFTHKPAGRAAPGGH
jgi:DHA2 family multidrug resistance protein